MVIHIAISPGCATRTGQFAAFLCLCYVSECCTSLREETRPCPIPCRSSRLNAPISCARSAHLVTCDQARFPQSFVDAAMPTCHCAKSNDPGHDPQLRLTRTVNGKTVAESFASPAAFQKAQAEVHEYQRWQRLCAELVDVSERICRLRPLQKETEKWSPQEKKRLLRSIKKSRVN